MSVISPDELASYLREPGPLNADLIVQLANDLVEDAVGTSVSADPPPRVRAIAFEVAARAYRNPQGFSSETIDDYTYRRDSETRQAGVYLTASERSELMGYGTTSASAYTIDFGTPYPWV